MQITHDKKLLIATGRSRKAAQWQNREMLWSEFLDKLSRPTRTRETVAEYAAMGKAERDNVKDIGGFVGGYLKNGRRSNAGVVNRCLVCLDADNADAALVDDLDMTFINAYALYSTHSHTPEKMRLRLIIPLSRTVTPDEYAAVSRRIADELTLARFDPTTFEPARLMYWPSAPEDGEYVFRYADEPFLDPDEVLATYPDWTDAALWPTTKPLEERARAKASKAEDPLEKRGIIGAFCRAHGITDVLEHILAGRYTATAQDDRYTFVGGSTTGGLVVYDDKYAYSHHATDPAGGQLCNAFDLVRLHLFTPGGTAPDGAHVGDGKDSVRRMQEYAAQDEATRRKLCEERREQAAQEFGDLDAQEAQPAQDENWQEKLEVDKQGRVKDTLGNLALILRNDPRLRDIAYNIHRSGIDIRRDAEGHSSVPWTPIKAGWNESDLGALQIYLEHVYGLYTPSKLKGILLAIAAERGYHPIRDYIESLPAWDGVPRVDTLFVDYLGAADTAYTRAVARKMMVAAVARVYRPGIKFDSVVVLNGPQGMGKSSFFAKLGGKWFSDSLTIGDMKDKAAPEKLQGYWILELGELAGLKKVDVETVKAFITPLLRLQRGRPSAAVHHRGQHEQRRRLFAGHHGQPPLLAGDLHHGGQASPVGGGGCGRATLGGGVYAVSARGGAVPHAGGGASGGSGADPGAGKRRARGHDRGVSGKAATRGLGQDGPVRAARFFARRPVHGRQPRRHGAAHGGQRGGDLGGVLRQGAHGHPAQRYLRHLRDAHEDRRLGEVQREQEQSPAPAAIWPAAMLPANRKGTARKRPGRAATVQGVTGIATISVTISEGYRRFVTVLEGYGERHTPFTTCINRKNSNCNVVTISSIRGFGKEKEKAKNERVCARMRIRAREANYVTPAPLEKGCRFRTGFPIGPLFF